MCELGEAKPTRTGKVQRLDTPLICTHYKRVNGDGPAADANPISLPKYFSHTIGDDSSSIPKYPDWLFERKVVVNEHGHDLPVHNVNAGSTARDDGVFVPIVRLYRLASSRRSPMVP